MKIALIITGQLGKFNFQEKNEKSLCDLWKLEVEKYNIDVFAITEENCYYNREEDCQIFSDNNCLVTNNNSFRLYKNIKNKTYEESLEYIENNILKKTFGNKLKKYEILNNSKSYNIHNFKNNLIKDNNHKKFYDFGITKGGRQESGIFSNISQFYKIEKCFELMKEYENEKKFKYDIVIRSRFDTIYNNINLNELEYSNNVYSPKTQIHMNDWFCIGNRFIMEKYCTYYLNYVPNLIDNYYCFLYHENGKIVEFEKKFNIKKKNKQCYDISDSSEVGLTYIIEKNKYNILNLNITGPLKVWS